MVQDIVIVRDYKVNPLLRRVWGIGEKVVYVIDESGDSGVVPIGFPKKDVFRYCSKCPETLNNMVTESVDWKKLAIYCANKI